MTSTLSFLTTITVLISCNNYKQSGNSDASDNENKPDTTKPIISTSFKEDAYPGIFESAFYNDTKVTQGDISYNFHNLEIGSLKIESGKIIAGHPVVLHDALSYTQTFPTGTFPVQLAMAKTSDDERVAFSRIYFSNERIAKWEFALHEGQKQIPLKDTNFYCYGVDAGTGLFIDSIAFSAFKKLEQSEWENIFITKAEKYGYKGFIHDFDGHNLATFSTGYGDGCYATYIGFDNQGKVCQLLTDFGLVNWWKLDEK